MIQTLSFYFYFNFIDTNMLESEIKSSIFKIATLEQQLLSEKNDRSKVEMEFKSYREKQAEELRVKAKFSNLIYSLIFLQRVSKR